MPAVGHRHSLLTVVERIHRYFAGDADAHELPARGDPERFARIVSQYLLFYSASASPADYAALTDGSLSAVWVHGILRYRDFATLDGLRRAVQKIRSEVPPEWRVAVAGPARELIEHGERLRRNWLSALAASAVLIFATVLAVFRNLRQALLSLVPAAAVLVAVTGLAPGFGVRIDDYTVIALAITLGLTVDYTIHVLNALHHAAPPGGRRPSVADAGGGGAGSLARGAAAARVRPGHPPAGDAGAEIVGGRAAPGRRAAAGRATAVGRAAAVVRGCGVPMFMSFLTSVVAFLSLAVSSFSGAVHFGIMIAAAILGALVMSLLIAGWHLARTEVA